MRGGFAARPAGRLRRGGVLTDITRRSTWWGAATVLALLAALLGAGVVTTSAIAASGSPASLHDARLVGARGPACIREVAVTDVSGSMTPYIGVRDDALTQVMGWARHNLRANDELAVVPWDDKATVSLQPTRVDHLASATLGSDVTGGKGGNVLAPALKLIAAMPRTSCETWLLFISDGELIGEHRTAVSTLLRAAHVDGVSIVLPTGAAAPAVWTAVFPYSSQFHANASDRDRTALAVGQAIAVATRQRLAR